MSATDELRRLLDERGVEYFKHEDGEPLRKLEKADEPATSWHMGGANACAVPIEGSDLFDLWIDHCTPEQAIAATLGTKRDRTEEWLLNACNQASADYIAELERKLEAATLGGGKLTAEQVRKAIRKYAQDDSCYIFEVYGEMCGPIADELNAELRSERHAYEQRITGDGSDWGEIMRGAYDDLMAAACESCTPEQIGQLADYISSELGSDASAVRLAERLRSIADEMRNVGASSMTPHELLACYAHEVDKVADSLKFAATLGNGTCRNEWAQFGKFRCSECWTQVDAISTNTTRPMPIRYCPNCGRMVRR